jgi:hypothetical protein
MRTTITAPRLPLPRSLCAPRSISPLAPALFIAASLLAGCGAGDPESSLYVTGQKPIEQPPANTVGGFTMAVPPITLKPGEEQSPCYIFPIDLKGPSRLVGGGSLLASPGMHHGNITTRPKTGEGVRECPDEGLFGGEAADVINGGTVLFASSTQVVGEEWQTFPEGMAFRIKDDHEIVARMHYLNTTTAPLTVTPVYQWYTIGEAALTQELGPFIWILSNFEIPPKSEHTVSTRCAIPEPMRVVNLLPHMHRLATGMSAWFSGGPLNGKGFLESRGYDPENGVLVQYEPSLDLSQGDGFGFSCSWRNTLNKTIVEGIGDNEMCMAFGYAWPPENAFSVKGTSEVCVYLKPSSP